MSAKCKNTPRGEFAYCERLQVTDGGKYGYVPVEVRVMARAEGYAMVRRKGAMPFVVAEKELTAIAKALGEG